MHQRLTDLPQTYPEALAQSEAVAGTFNAQDVTNTLWAYATMGREPGAGLMMRELEGRAEALAGTFKIGRAHV